MPQEKIFAQARDELFSHINRCEVLSATDDDRTAWMDETIDYIGERYPDLVDPDLRELHAVGIRFCSRRSTTYRCGGVRTGVRDRNGGGAGRGGDDREADFCHLGGVFGNRGHAGAGWGRQRRLTSYTGDSHPQPNGGKLRFPAVFPLHSRKRAFPERSCGMLAKPRNA